MSKTILEDSRNEWIGDIPKKWNIKRLKFVTKFLVSTVNRHEYDYEIPVSICHYPQVYNNEKISLKTTLSKGTCTQKELERFRLKKDDVLITKDSETRDDIGVPAYIENDFENTVCGYHLAQLSTNKNQILGSFLFKYIQSNFVNAYFETEAKGITRYGLDKDSINNLKLLLPSILEQKKIVEYLDRKIEKIEKNIYQNIKLIELLERKKKSTINQAITKGLDPFVHMKDSGVEWIGEIPEHWKKKKLGRSFNFGSGTTPNSSNKKYYEGKIPWVNTGDLNDGIIHNIKKSITDIALKKYSILKIFPKNTLIIAMYGATIGKLGILNERATTNQACCNLYGSKEIDSKFMFYWFLINRKQIISMAQGGGQPNINQNLIKNLKIWTPEINEQKQILELLNEEIPKFDTIILNSEKLIKKLQAYRKSLISLAVTGKIDVRGAIA